MFVETCFWLYFIIISYNIDIKYEQTNTGETVRVASEKEERGRKVMEMLQSI